MLAKQTSGNLFLVPVMANQNTAKSVNLLGLSDIAPSTNKTLRMACFDAIISIFPIGVEIVSINLVILII